MSDSHGSGDFRPESGWVEVAQFGSALEAEVARAVLAAGGYDAIASTSDAVGIFGPNFMGRTARGASVAVPAEQAASARTFLANRGEGEEEAGDSDGADQATDTADEDAAAD